VGRQQPKTNALDEARQEHNPGIHIEIDDRRKLWVGVCIL
jgi:hypothetical protein